MLEKIDIKYFKLAVGSANIGTESDSDISARCPVCGDGNNKRNKRLHLYNKGSVTNVNCFNGGCAVQNKTVHSFLRDFFPSIFAQYKKETFGDTLEKLSSGDVFKQFIKSNDSQSTEEQIKPVLTQDFSEYFTDISDSQKALDYLNRRNITYTKEYGKWYYGHQDLKIGDVLYKLSDSIIIPLYFKNEMYGFYSRKIDNKQFCTYMNSNNIGYKIWNWFNVDNDKPVYIFEGIFDAISSSLKNVIALMGASIPEDRLSELKNPVFVLDNDKTGMINSLKYAKRGFNVYIQPNEYKEKDMNELLMNHNGLNVPLMIQNNILTGISAEVRIKCKL